MLGIDYSFKSDNLFLPNSDIVTVALDIQNLNYNPSFYFVRLKEKHYSEVSRLIVKKI